ncbi:hypothetical protein K505DRAFT_330021 [Melanomma pulvis-pyrius CBS 109.77]|uniref:Uncharacterized protein n=1 Tax=Melanomma pulvis-pyrius CBS 109.77 TaxID=1314802 RepID=A0A6A6WS36_9PLEO|nr:hypothetical protein K505DRAFT_330021 [Melanomma pulvis-pyrius CBS 109.77]
MATVTAQLENYSIYVLLSLRAGPGFHWGLFVPTNKPHGEVWHATNRQGGWLVEAKSTSGVPTSITLCLAFKVGTVNSANWETLRSTLGNVAGNGQPSPNTGEAFTCRVWVEDALLALHNAGVISLTQAITTIEQRAIETAETNREQVELGGRAMVWNATGFSTTA